jgi:3-dehydroquinate synthase
VCESLASADFAVHVARFPAGEVHKTLATVGVLFDQIFAAPVAPDRDSLVVALGGGVVGDVAGFVAATLLRGVHYLQVPTTLLADVDSSVGGKTAVDHPSGKNLIGAFHQPRAVCIDPATLATLDRAELSAGLAECLKHGVIRDASLVDWIEQHADSLLARDGEVLAELIERNVRIKAQVVSADEREAGERAHLNFGHTIGHAVEAKFSMEGPANMGFLRHGECVALGMAGANFIAVRRGLLGREDARRLERLLIRLELPVRRSGLNSDELLDLMRHDKKCRDGKIRFILARRIGQVDIFSDVADDEVGAAIHYLNGVQ